MLPNVSFTITKKVYCYVPHYQKIILATHTSYSIVRNSNQNSPVASNTHRLHTQGVA